MDAGNQGVTFISYSRRDSEFALELVSELRAAGFAIWFDQLDIQPGSRWDDEIEKALTQCTIFMVILTPSSTASNNVKDEISYAIDNNKLIMPVLLKDAVVPLRLRRFQYVDFTGKSCEEGIEAAKQLLDELLMEGSSWSRVTIQPFEHNYTTQIHTNARKDPEHSTKKAPSTRMPLIIMGILLAFTCTLFVLGYLAKILRPGVSDNPANVAMEAGGISLTATEPYTPAQVPSELLPSPIPTSQPTVTPDLPTIVVPTNPPPTEAVPNAYGFQACLSPCNGQNYVSTFPEAIQKIHFQYNYENIPAGASFTRTWSMGGQEWIRYICNWDGPPTGVEQLRFTEPMGLYSGEWTVTVWVNNEIILQENITITGNWTYWDPAGVKYSCRGNN